MGGGLKIAQKFHILVKFRLTVGEKEAKLSKTFQTSQLHTNGHILVISVYLTYMVRFLF